jgi:hypothetical protein
MSKCGNAPFGALLRRALLRESKISITANKSHMLLQYLFEMQTLCFPPAQALSGKVCSTICLFHHHFSATLSSKVFPLIHIILPQDLQLDLGIGVTFNRGSVLL